MGAGYVGSCDEENRTPVRYTGEVSVYAELHCHTNFSFLDGASHPEDLVAPVPLNRGGAVLVVTNDFRTRPLLRASLASADSYLGDIGTGRDGGDSDGPAAAEGQSADGHRVGGAAPTQGYLELRESLQA